MWDRLGPWSADEDDLREGVRAFARAVEARSRQATPAPDAVAEAIQVMRVLADLAEQDMKLNRDEGDGGYWSLSIVDAIENARAFIATHTTQKTGEG